MPASRGRIRGRDPRADVCGGSRRRLRSASRDCGGGATFWTRFDGDGPLATDSRFTPGIMSVKTRAATLLDLPSLVALNRAAYPDLIEDGVVFEAAQLRTHQAVFPEGQRVAVDDGRVVGAIATLILPRTIDPLRAHTWMGVTDGGTFARHDGEGDTLYLADVYVGPDSWGKGVGKALYAELFDLCRRLQLTRRRRRRAALRLLRPRRGHDSPRVRVARHAGRPA